jgi:hypothetical protein
MIVPGTAYEVRELPALGYRMFGCGVRQENLTPTFVIPAVAKHCRRQNAGIQSALIVRQTLLGCLIDLSFGVLTGIYGCLRGHGSAVGGVV